MNDDVPQLEQSRFAEKARPWAAATILVAAATLGWTVAEGVGSFLDSVRVQLSDSASCCESFRAYRAEDSAQRTFWIDVIQRIREEDARASERLSQLSTDLAVLSARMDAARIGGPRDDDREWRTEIDKLRQRLDAELAE